MSNQIQNVFLPGQMTGSTAVGGYCPVCSTYYTGGVHICPGNRQTQPPGLVSEDRLREIISETVRKEMATYLVQLVRQAISDDRDAQQRDYNNRKLAREREEEERAREEKECSRLKSV